jgi:hypothetical protein
VKAKIIIDRDGESTVTIEGEVDSYSVEGLTDFGEPGYVESVSIEFKRLPPKSEPAKPKAKKPLEIKWGWGDADFVGIDWGKVVWPDGKRAIEWTPLSPSAEKPIKPQLPHVCPNCKGDGKRLDSALERVTCHACAGTGIVWGPP